MKSKDYVLAEEAAWEAAGEGMRRQILGYDGQIMMVKVAFQEGAIGVGHKHYHSQTTYVSSGVYEFYIEDKKQIIKPGDGVYIAPEAYHGVTCLEPGILIDVFTPVREDFLKK